MTDERTRLIEALKMLEYLKKYFQERLATPDESLKDETRTRVAWSGPSRGITGRLGRPTFDENRSG